MLYIRCSVWSHGAMTTWCDSDAWQYHDNMMWFWHMLCLRGQVGVEAWRRSSGIGCRVEISTECYAWYWGADGRKGWWCGRGWRWMTRRNCVRAFIMIANSVQTQHAFCASWFEGEGVYPSDLSYVNSASSGGEEWYDGACHSDIASYLGEKKRRIQVLLWEHSEKFIVHEKVTKAFGWPEHATSFEGHSVLPFASAQCTWVQELTASHHDLACGSHLLNLYVW